jgi:hypothetical protein
MAGTCRIERNDMFDARGWLKPEENKGCCEDCSGSADPSGLSELDGCGAERQSE